MQGWIKLHRKILDNEIWHDVTTFRLFTLLLLQAVHKDGVKVKGIELKRGQYLRSYSKLAEDLEYKEKRGYKKVSKSTVLRSVKKLVEEGMVSVCETDYGTVFTILKYHEYQGFDDDNETLIETVNEPLSERNRNVIETLSKQEQELKNLRIKECKEDTTTTTAAVENPILLFEKLLCRLSHNQSHSLYQWVDDFGGKMEIINEAITIADNKNKRYFGFVEFLLKEWANNNLDSLDRVRAYEQEKFNKAKIKPYPRKGPVRTEMLPEWFYENEQPKQLKKKKTSAELAADKAELDEMLRRMGEQEAPNNQEDLVRKKAELQEKLRKLKSGS
ncbi:DnaD domain protein [Cytobacillus firmus]|uniref:DnaD domain protein n=1 Tax=Cytobacillus firmus DS1 TaxID=1307436 RepID=W7LC35_CYTFI|nr:DnaD domain protein [Cytobacillus firmus]EWG12722.1 DnaD domain protein [Cytobacillus firmus DS1]